MVNNAGDVLKLCISTKRNHKLTVDMRVIFHINDILNYSLQKFLMFMKNITPACTLLHADLLPLQCSNVCLSRQQASLYLDRFYCQNAYVHAYNAFSSPKLIILHRYLNEINTVNQLQLNYSTNIHLLIPRFMKRLCVVTIN